MVAAPSIVKMHNQSYTLTAPTSAAADWDATVAFTGVNSEIAQLPGLVTGDGSIDNLLLYDHAAISAGAPFGSFVMKAGVAGAPLTWGAPITVDDTHVAYGACAVSPDSDRCRIIAVAFEITNTTAEIYKQGSITVASLPAAVNDYGNVMYVDENVAPDQNLAYQSLHTVKFAATRDALISVPGATTWAAKDGAYVIPRMITHTMPVENPAKNKRAAVVQDSLSDTAYHLTTPHAKADLADLDYPLIRGVAPSGFTAVQVFLNGLSHETSVTITMRTIVEYFPSFNSALLPLTTPSPPFCPKAFEIYSRVAQIAPYAVPVKQNSAGEYFRKILGIVSMVGSALSPVVGPVGMIAGGIGMGAGALKAYLDKRDEDRKKRFVPPNKPLPQPPRVRRDEAGARSLPTRR